MKKTAYAFCFISLFIVSFQGCSFLEKDGTIEGNIFIVTNGSQAIKLPLVQVVAIPEDEVMRHIKNCADTAVQLSVSIKKKLFVAHQDLMSNQIACAKAQAKTDGLLADYKEAQADFEKKYLFNYNEDDKWKEFSKLGEDLKKIDDAYQVSNILTKKSHDSFLAFQSIMDDIKIWPTINAEVYFKSLPLSSMVSKTNEDGKFSIKIPKKGKFALAVRAQRQAGNAHELYHWFIWVSLDGSTSNKITLCNDNLLSSQSSESVVELINLDWFETLKEYYTSEEAFDKKLKDIKNKIAL